MKKAIKTHFETRKHRGGPLRVTTKDDMPKKSGKTLCGVLLDENNLSCTSKENVTCNECLNKINSF
ncbi:MAG: hypothetical protein AAB814_00670 [Patescibacteria group bacterium]